MTAWPLPPLSVGEFAPSFSAPTRVNPNFHFNTLAGRYLLLAFLPRDDRRRAEAMAAFETIRPRFDDNNLTAFFIATDPESVANAQDRIPGQRWFFDPEGVVSRLYGAWDEGGAENPHWLLLDPGLRVLDRAALEAPGPLFAQIAALPPLGSHAGVAMVAPVLIVPRVFEAEFCRRLIAYYDARGGEVSGVMRDIGGKTVGVLDNMKRRRDVTVAEPEFRKEIVERLEKRLLPMISRALQFQATRIERYLVACYDAGEGGFFRAHRDNEALATAHRRFAVSINLNAEDFEGGDLRFPEFGQHTYRPPTGGAVVFCCSLQHEATNVTRGRRYAFLPFLHDEAGERIREQNRSFLDGGRAHVMDDR
jgi:predicted 2-oxoglutarate/Fe(II)-dependent dioxygenase YbiX/peroxiredoxin